MKKKPTILIIDDQEPNRILLYDMMINMNYQPILAENGMIRPRDVEIFVFRMRSALTAFRTIDDHLAADPIDVTKSGPTMGHLSPCWQMLR